MLGGRVSSVAVGDFAFLFNCTPGGSGYGHCGGCSCGLICWWDGRCLVLLLLSGPPGFACWVSFAPVFGFIYCSLSLFCLLLCLGLCVLGDDALIGWGSFVRHLCVLIHI